MYSITALMEQLPVIAQSRMIASGYGLWIIWSGNLAKALVQTLQDYGGIQIVSAANQSFWYFFTKDAFRAVARLQVWAKLNPVPISIQLVPCTFLVGFDMKYTVSIGQELRGQQITGPSEFEVWVHPRLGDDIASIPGLSTAPANALSGMANVGWKAFHADSNFSYEATLGWYFLLKPLGNQLDKEFSMGWRAMFSAVEPLLQRYGRKYIYNDSSLILPLESLRLFRSWCKDIVNVIRANKAEGRGYWPCVMVAVPRANLNFNEDLPRKLSLDWNRLTPDYPHLSYKSAFLLGAEFVITELNYSTDQNSVDDWCHVSLRKSSGDGSEESGLVIPLPKRLLAGSERECFSCGLKGHKLSVCPTHALTEAADGIWREIARIPVDEFAKVAQEMNAVLDESPADGLAKLLQAEGRAGVMARAIFEISLPFQHRMLRQVWRSRSKDWHNAFEQLGPEEGEFIWAALQRLSAGGYAEAEGLIKQASLRYPRSYQPRSLAGFLHLETGDINQALYFWQESERLSYTAVQKAYFLMLQGRLHESLCEYEKAIACYKQAEAQAWTWLDTLYRQAVCMVKMGFTDHAIHIFSDLIVKDPAFFNRILIDPELERGRFQVLSWIGDVWKQALELRSDSQSRLEELAQKLTKWFAEDHPFTIDMQQRIERLKQSAQIKNYYFFHRLSQGCDDVERLMEQRIESELVHIRGRADYFFEKIRDVHREAAWFPFPKLLREFNRDFNFCAEKLNWMKTSHLKLAENFKKSYKYIFEIDEKLKNLQARLVTLRIIRDSTLFVLLLGRNFIWMQLLGLGLALVLVPILVYSAQYMSEYVADLILTQRWQLQKGLIIILSIVAVAVAALKTAISFEKKKQQIFDLEQKKLNEARKNKRKKVARKRATAKGQAQARKGVSVGTPGGGGQKPANPKGK